MKDQNIAFAAIGLLTCYAFSATVVVEAKPTPTPSVTPTASPTPTPFPRQHQVPLEIWAMATQV